MQFTIYLLKEDYVYLSVLLGLKRPALKNILFFAFLFLVVTLTDGIQLIEESNIYNIIANIAIFVIFMAIFNVLTYTVIEYKVGKLLKKSPEQIGKKEIIIDENSIKIKAELDEGIIQWKSFIEFIETDKYFILLNTTVSGIIITKRDLETDGITKSVKEFLVKKSLELNIKYKT